MRVEVIYDCCLLCICKSEKNYNLKYIQEYRTSEIYSCQGIASLFQGQASRLSWIQHNLLKQGCQGDQSFRYSRILTAVMRKKLLGFSFFVSIKYIVFFLSKIQQKYLYTQMCIQRKAFVFKPISNQLNILVGCNLSLTKSLNTSLP